MKPYIGISAVMDRMETRSILEFIPDDAMRQVTIGTVANLKTLRGQPNSWPQRFPSMEQIARIFLDDPRLRGYSNSSSRSMNA